MKCLYVRFLLPVFPIHFSPVLSSPAPQSLSLWFLMSPHVDTSPLCNALLCLFEAAAHCLLFETSSSQASFPGSLSVSLAVFYSSFLLGWVPHPPLAAWKKVLTPCSGLLYSL